MQKKPCSLTLDLNSQPELWHGCWFVDIITSQDNVDRALLMTSVAPGDQSGSEFQWFMKEETETKVMLLRKIPRA